MMIIQKILMNLLFFGLIVGGIFFYATYTYDFIQKYSDAEIKTKIIFKFLLFGSIFYFVLTVFSIFILIHTLVHRELINMLFNISKWIFIISSIPCYYPTVEIFDRIKQRYLGKISKATV